MTQHYFSETPAGELHPREIDVVLAGERRVLLTAGGVFSPEHLDRGTAVLLAALDAEDLQAPSETPGHVLDLGCGWGPIALHAALTRADSVVWAVDVNERARELTARNAERLGLGNVRAVAPDGVPEGIRFSSIRSNPPIRVGKPALHGILRQWLPRLDAGGTAHLVVAKHLGADSLQRWIATEFPELAVRRAARDRGFHVIEAHRSHAHRSDAHRSEAHR